jgi:two-component system, cell cycle response regulator DivK
MRSTGAPILIVDDFLDALEMYGEFLQFHGYRVLLARSGEEAIDLARADPPALILMDLEMPGVDGVQALHILRSDDAFRHTPIVALTAHALASEREEALLNGFDGVIAKPCLPNDLITEIERILVSQRQA